MAKPGLRNSDGCKRQTAPRSIQRLAPSTSAPTNSTRNDADQGAARKSPPPAMLDLPQRQQRHAAQDADGDARRTRSAWRRSGNRPPVSGPPVMAGLAAKASIRPMRDQRQHRRQARRGRPSTTSAAKPLLSARDVHDASFGPDARGKLGDQRAENIAALLRNP